MPQFEHLNNFSSGGDEVATAIVSVTSLTGTGSVHVNLLMSGLFNNDNVGSGLAVKFEWNTDNGTTEAIFEDLVIPKINNVRNVDIFSNNIFLILELTSGPITPISVMQICTFCTDINVNFNNY